MNQKGNSLIYVLLGLLVIIVLLIPWPYYEQQNGCDLPTLPTQSQNCPHKGWHLGQPLWQKIANLYKIDNPQDRIAIQVSPTQIVDQTADWKTYTNTAVGFSIKYPSRYSTPTFNDPNTDFSLVNGKEDNTVIDFGSSQSDNVSLQVFPYTGKLEDIEIYKPLPFIDGLHISSPSEVTVSGQKGIIYLARPTDNSSSTLKIYFTGNNHGFILEANLGHSDEELKEILSTFKFTDQTTTSSNKLTINVIESNQLKASTISIDINDTKNIHEVPLGSFVYLKESSNLSKTTLSCFAQNAAILTIPQGTYNLPKDVLCQFQAVGLGQTTVNFAVE